MFKYAGTVSHGTMQEQDLIPSFLGALEELNRPVADGIRLEYEDTIAELDLYRYPDDVYVPQLIETLFDALDNEAPDGYYFGAHPGDGSDYGFWEAEE